MSQMMPVKTANERIVHNKTMYVLGYRHLVIFSDGTPAIYVKPSMSDSDLPSDKISHYITVLENGTLRKGAKCST